MQKFSFVKIKKWFADFFASFMAHDVLTLAAALAFYTALALAPLLLITMSVVGVLGSESKDILISRIQVLTGPEASTAITAVIEAAQNQPQKGGVAGAFGLLVLLFSASGVFAQLQSSLNVIWDATSKKETSSQRSWLRKRILSLGMVLSLGFLAVVSLIISAVLSFFFTQDGSVFEVLNNLISVVIFTSMFALIYKYLPDERLSWKHAWIGGTVTALFFMIGKAGIGVYLKQSAVGSAYGAAGSVIVLLAWVYYSAVIVFSGAEVTRLVAAHDGNIAAQTNDLAKAKSTNQLKLSASTL